VGDVVTLTFTRPTNTPVSPVVFTPPLGALAFSWQQQGQVLVVRVVDGVVDGVPVRPFDVDVGKARVQVVGVTAAGGASPSTPSLSVAVGGTWGIPTPPSIVLVEAVDTGRQQGLGTNDSMVILFDQEVRRWVVVARW
jgi:hypothetical protein